MGISAATAGFGQHGKRWVVFESCHVGQTGCQRRHKLARERGFYVFLCPLRKTGGFFTLAFLNAFLKVPDEQKARRSAMRSMDISILLGDCYIDFRDFALMAQEFGVGNRYSLE